MAESGRHSNVARCSSCAAPSGGLRDSEARGGPLGLSGGDALGLRDGALQTPGVWTVATLGSAVLRSRVRTCDRPPPTRDPAAECARPSHRATSVSLTQCPHALPPQRPRPRTTRGLRSAVAPVPSAVIGRVTCSCERRVWERSTAKLPHTAAAFTPAATHTHAQLPGLPGAVTRAALGGMTASTVQEGASASHRNTAVSRSRSQGRHYRQPRTYARVGGLTLARFTLHKRSRGYQPAGYPTRAASAPPVARRPYPHSRRRRRRRSSQCVRRESSRQRQARGPRRGAHHLLHRAASLRTLGSGLH